MNTVLNVLWYFPYFGFLMAIPMALGGLLMCITVVGLPLGLGMLQIAKFLLLPFSRQLVDSKELNELTGREGNKVWEIFSLIVRILYFPIGLFAAAVYIIAGLVDFITIIGIPNGLVMFRLIPSVFNPVGKKCVPAAVADHMQMRRDQNTVNRYLGNTSEPQQQQPNSAPVSEVSSYSDEELDKILNSPELYNPALVQECVTEKEIRQNASALMPRAREMSIAERRDVIANPARFSPALVHCCRTVERERNEQLRAEYQAREEAARQRRREEMERRLQATKEFLLKWKYYIIGGVALLIAVIYTCHVTSDSYRMNQAVKAWMNGDAEKTYKYASKITNPKSEYFPGALILSDMTAQAQGEEAVAKTQERMDKALANTSDGLKPYHAYAVWKAAGYICDTAYVTDETKAAYNRVIELMTPFADTNGCARFTLAQAYFFSGQYQKAYDLFLEVENLGQFDDTYGGLDLDVTAAGYIGVLNMFNLIDDPCDTEDAWEWIGRGPSEGSMFAMFKGDYNMLNSNYKTAKDFYERAALASLPNKVLKEMASMRYNIATELNDHSLYHAYSYNNSNGRGNYYGSTRNVGWSRGADGWGIFKNNYKNFTNINGGEFKFTDNEVINSINTLVIYEHNKEDNWLSCTYKDGKFNTAITNDGEFTWTYYSPETDSSTYMFNPLWFQAPGSFMNISFDFDYIYLSHKSPQTYLVMNVHGEGPKSFSFLLSPVKL